MIILETLLQTLKDLWFESGLYAFVTSVDGLKSLAMILISFVFMFLAIKKGFEPLLLLPIAFGMLLTNIPNAGSTIRSCGRV